MKSFVVKYLFINLLLFSWSFGQIKLTINVISPPDTPTDSSVYLSGNHPSAGAWDARRTKMNRLNDSLWTFTLSLPDSFPFEFKATLGSWQREAIYIDSVTPPNIQITMTKDTTITLRPRRWKNETLVVTGGITGTVTYHTGLKGEGLEYPRDLIVWLPPSYSKETSKRYPVLYMHDGQNIFDPKTSFSNYDWQVDEAADSLIKQGELQEIIIVGIYNSPDRREEYAETTKGIAYQSFMINVVKPLIDSTYRTLPDAQHTGVMGSSMGGLVSFLMAWKYPDVFSMAGCLSPAFFPKVIDTVKQYSGPRKHIRLYIDNGGKGLDLQLQKGCDSMLAVLRKKGFEDGKNLQWYLDSAADHHERFWAKRIAIPLKFMFGIPKENKQ